MTAPLSQSLAPISETAERFLRAVVAKVPLDRIEELHLFSPLRQGAIETGIAVLAAREPVVVLEVEAVGATGDPELLLAEAAGEEPGVPDLVEEAVAVEDASVDLAVGEETIVEVAIVEDAIAEAPVAVAPPIDRLTVYTARYRLVIKGPDRGKWEADLKAEADAPLVTVETVVRGVQRRAGEDSEIFRYTAEQLARLLRVPVAG